MKALVGPFALVVWLSVIPDCAEAQNGPGGGGDWLASIGAFVERYQISLRQSVLDKNAIEKPASFQFVHPSDGKDSYSIDFGLTASLFPKDSILVPADHWYIGPTVEYHRQTQIKKEQDNFQAGLTAIWILGDIAEGSAHFTQLSLKYKDDKKGVGEGFLGKLEYTPLSGKLWMGVAKGPDWLQVLWQPTVGVQFERADAVGPRKASGNVTRAKGALEVGLYPWGRALRKRFEISVMYTYWRYLAESGGYQDLDKDHDLLRVAATYYLFNDPEKGYAFGVGLEYTNGEDVEQGRQDQETVSLSLKVKF